MERRFFIRNTAILAGASILVQKRALAQLFRTSEFNIKMLHPNVGIFTERGGTIGFLLSDEGLIAIDSQFPDTARHFIEEVKKLKAKPFSFLLNTHHHGDHTGGNIAFKGLTAHVLAHENALANLRTVAEKGNTLDKQLLPDSTFSDEVKIKLGGEKIKGYYFGAAHTNGDAVYHLEEADVVHVGDLVFNRRHPFVDRSAGASMSNWITVLEKMSRKFSKKTTYVFGHAAPGYEVTGTREDVLAFRDYLQKVLEFTRKEIAAGRSKEDFIKATEIPGATEWKGDGIQRPLTAAYEELTSS